MRAPRFAEIPTFMRAPLAESLEGLDIAMVGVPFDGGVSNRTGARHGPREIRNMSSLMRPIHHVSRVNPYELCTVADVGDVHFSTLYEAAKAVGDIETFFGKLHEAGVAPLSAGGDHAITYPIFRAIARERPVGMVHIDAHTDTWDEYFGAKFHHGSPFRLATEEGLLDPKRTIQIGIRGAQLSTEPWDYSLEKGMRVVFMDEFARAGVDAIVEESAHRGGRRPHLHLLRRGRPRSGLRSGHRHSGGRRPHHPGGADAAPGPARARHRRRGRGGGGAALRPERQHRARGGHHDVRDPVPHGRGRGGPQVGVSGGGPGSGGPVDAAPPGLCCPRGSAARVAEQGVVERLRYRDPLGRGPGPGGVAPL